MTNAPVEEKKDPIATCIFNYKEEASAARLNRMISNQENFEAYNLRQNFSHKRRGQSKEFLPKQMMAVEQITSFLQQGLMDLGDWFSMEFTGEIDPNTPPLLTPDQLKKLILRQLDKNSFAVYIADCIKSGLLGALMISKIGGKQTLKSKYEARSEADTYPVPKKKKLVRIDKKHWQLDLSLVRQQDYYPDPTGRGLYEVQRITMDKFELIELAKANPDVFDLEACKNCTPSDDDLQQQKKSQETGQNIPMGGYRRTVTLYECWGTFLDPEGEVIMENGVAAIDINGTVVRPLKKNPLWHGKSPYVVSSIIRTPNSVWHRALMDATTKLNLALNETYNLMLDAGISSVFGVRQIRTDWLENPSKVADGIPPGETLEVNGSCPPGQKVLERVDTGALTNESLQMYNLTDRELLQASMSNDTRTGSLPQRAVKATEIVASNQAITGVFNGIVKLMEDHFVKPLLEECWLTMAQHMNDLDDDECKALLGNQLALRLANMANEEIFAQTATGLKYKVFGLSTTLNKMQDFRKITALLQSIGTSPEMMQDFKQTYSIARLVGEIIKSLDIDEDKLKLSDQEKQQQAIQQAQQQQQEIAAEQAKKGGGNPQSQIPQMNAQGGQDDGGIAIPRGQNNQGMTHP